MAHDVFISYSSKDQSAADAVCDALQANGMRCWIATRNIAAGAAWAESIVDAITQCRLLILVFSENANASRQVAREVAIADDHALPIAPIRISDAKLSKTLQFYLSASQWLNAHGHPLERLMPELVARVKATLGVLPPSRHTPVDAIERSPEMPPVPAPRPMPAGVFTNSLAIKFARIDPGEFLMGSPQSEAGRGDNETQHKVKLSRPYLLAATPVTQAHWTALMGKNPSHFKGEDRPVENVSWEEAAKFCEAMSRKEDKRYRLPTEAEWEYACRAGATTRFYTGDGERALAEAAWYDGNSAKQTQPVARKKPNAWGLHDMLGNVWEWCYDHLGAYPTQPIADPEGPLVGSSRVLRGGSWIDFPRCCRSAYRNGDARGYRRNSIGFRLALTIQ